MTDRTGARLAWVVLGIVGAVYTFALVLSLLNRSVDVLVFAFFFFAVIGALVASSGLTTPSAGSCSPSVRRGPYRRFL